MFRFLEGTLTSFTFTTMCLLQNMGLYVQWGIDLKDRLFGNANSFSATRWRYKISWNKAVRSSGNGCTQSSTGLINAVLSGIIGKIKWKFQRYVSEDSRFPSEIHSHKDIRAVFSLQNVQRSYLFNYIIAFWSLIQRIATLAFSLPTVRPLEIIIKTFLYHLTYLKLKALKTLQFSCIKCKDLWESCI